MDGMDAATGDGSMWRLLPQGNGTKCWKRGRRWRGTCERAQSFEKSHWDAFRGGREAKSHFDPHFGLQSRSPCSGTSPSTSMLVHHSCLDNTPPPQSLRLSHEKEILSMERMGRRRSPLCRGLAQLQTDTEALITHLPSAFESLFTPK